MMRTLSPILFLCAMGCSNLLGSDELTAAEEMLISTISGEEEGFLNHRVGAEENAPEGERPKMFRVCQRGEFYRGIFERYDANSNASLETEEGEAVLAEREGRDKKHMRKLRKLMDLMLWVYDVDEDGSISEVERELLFADFDERCEVMHEKILAEFDADGDGELNDEEKQAAHDAKNQKRDEYKASDGKKGGKKAGKKGQKGEKPDWLEDGTLPPFAEKYDADEDGELNEAEMEQFRTEMREKIKSGEPFGKCDKDEIEEQEEVEEQEESLVGTDGGESGE